MLRDEIRETRRGNRAEAIDQIEGAVNAEQPTATQTGGGATPEGNSQERDAAIAAILADNPAAR